MQLCHRICSSSFGNTKKYSLSFFFDRRRLNGLSQFLSSIVTSLRSARSMRPFRLSTSDPAFCNAMRICRINTPEYYYNVLVGLHNKTRNFLAALTSASSNFDSRDLRLLSSCTIYLSHRSVIFVSGFVRSHCARIYLEGFGFADSVTERTSPALVFSLCIIGGWYC